jgi:hypothetical protein
VAANLFRPRSQWPAEELIERSLATITNPAVIDRRLQELDTASVAALAFMARSRLTHWHVGHLVELLTAVGHGEGLQPILRLLESGLLFPSLGVAGQRVRDFEQWLGSAGATPPRVFTHPVILSRSLKHEISFPDLPPSGSAVSGIFEADGLDILLRLAAAWQQLGTASLRRTQQGDFFKRDMDRLRTDPVLSAIASDGLAPAPDAGLLIISVALILSIITEEQGELHAGLLPAEWQQGLAGAIPSLWSALLSVDNWNPQDGWRVDPDQGNPYPSAYLLLLLLVAGQPRDSWTAVAGLEQWLVDHHPYWEELRRSPGRTGAQMGRKSTGGAREDKSPRGATPGHDGLPWVANFLLGVAYPLRLVQAAKDEDGEWMIRLSDWGRWLLGCGDSPPPVASYPQTLLVQPNLEVVLYRQGLTPALIVRLSHFAAWKNLGAACTLQLQADTIYRGLESGLTFETILQTLEQHGMHALPPAVLSSLRTWADKRERITIYSSATLLEFESSEDLKEALARGLPGARLTDRLVAVAHENEIDYRHFRLTGTRDYGLPPEKCVEVEADGVTLAVDLARSDLLLETELRRFAEALDGAGIQGKHRYRLTPQSLAGMRDRGLGVSDLEDWFYQRAGQALSPAARLLLTAPVTAAPQLHPALVLQVPTAEMADGLLQWPGTRGLLQDRLGPTALVIAEEDVEAFCERLAVLGMKVEPPSTRNGTPPST